jgi:phosphoglycerol transferase
VSPPPTATAPEARLRWPSPTAGTWLACGLAVLVTTAALPAVSDFWKGDFRVPVGYQGDALLYQPLIKGLGETGTHWANPWLAAPDGFELYDFPMPEGWHFLTLRGLVWACGDWAVAFNLFVLGQFPLAALTGTWVLRRFGAGVLPAVLGGVLFAYLPHHGRMFHQHIFLCAYYPIPLGVWLVVRVFRGELAGWRRWVGAGGVCLLLGATGAYYAFFTCGLLVAAGVAATLNARKWTALLPAGVSVAVIGGVLAVNLAPSFLHTREHGANPEMKRHVAEANFWALRPAELLLPSPLHRSKQAAAVSRWYAEQFGATMNEDVAGLVPLGVVGSVGLLLGLCTLLKRDTAPTPDYPSVFARLLAVGLLVAVVGGFGPLFNLVVSPWVRCYHRIAVLLGFVSLAVVALTLTRAAPPTAKRWWQVAVGVWAVLWIGVGLYDQTPKPVSAPFADRAAAFDADRRFVTRVEEALPPGAVVFQLPHVPYPEAGFVYEIDNYTPAVPYLHSHTLRWSYGAMRGRPAAVWQREVSSLPAAELLEQLSARGFEHVWIDRWGYPGRSPQIESGLASAADGPPLVSDDGRHAVYSFTRGRNKPQAGGN